MRKTKKQIEKITLDSATETLLLFYKSGKKVFLEIHHENCDELSEQAFNSKCEWGLFTDIITGAVKNHRLEKDENKFLYSTVQKIFELLGFEVVGEVK